MLELPINKQPPVFSAKHLICIYSIILINYLNVQYVHSFTVFDDHHPQECELDRNSKHEFISPMLIISREENSSIPLSDSVNCSNTLRIFISGLGSKFVIDLVKNRRLISDRYFKISKNSIINRHDRHPDSSKSEDPESSRNEMFLNLHNFTTNDDHCHYHGSVNDNLNSISAISIVNQKLLSGFFHDGSDIYYLHANTTSSSTILTKPNDLCSTKQEASKVALDRVLSQSNFTYNDDKGFLPAIKRRSKRSFKNRRGNTSTENMVKHGPFQSNSSSLYVEMLVVHDHSQYVEYDGNTSLLAERTMQIVNIMNAFYRQLNIFIALVGVVLWVEKDEIELTDDGDVTLTNFLKYRFEKLLPKYHHDNAQLITNTSFNGSVVGKALKGPICTHEHSGGVSMDHSHSPAVVAVTIAHELGHNFGMEHDEEDKCKCPDEKCIMSASSSTVHPKHWSSCSIEHLEDAKKHGLLNCLTNEPEKVFGPICGNGFVEEGEDCDLGEQMPTFGTSKSRQQSLKCTAQNNCNSTSISMSSSSNTCCDRRTCKFTANATCAQGPCCDLSRCSVYNSTEVKVCRPRQSECDLEEVCDGKGEFCPPDVYYHDGIECDSSSNSMRERQHTTLFNSETTYNRHRGYCYKGICASHESQCQLLWGPSGYVSKDICYDQNVHGNTSGNCGFDRRDKTYNTCEPEDAICGMLHCVHNQQQQQPIGGDSRKTGKLGYGFESASILTVSFFVMSNHSRIYCHGAIIDAGPNAKDPGLVPNGAACGQDRMCLNQKCIPVYDVLYKNWCPSDCNGNGICDNVGVCHCNDGTIGSSCYQFFGPNFQLSLLLYIIMFFVPMVGLLVFVINHYRSQIKIWWFLHRRKIALKERGTTKHHSNNLQARLAYGVKENKITISEPILLNQPSNTNRPFYEPVLDPWAETSCQTDKNLGYRLEIINKSTNSTGTIYNNSLTNNSAATTTDNSPAGQTSFKPVRAAPPPPSQPAPNQRA